MTIDGPTLFRRRRRGISVARALATLALAMLHGAEVAAAQARPIPRAHAHNDYRHARPLLEALEHGFESVEADIHLVEGTLLVAHDPEEVRPDRTLEGLYLDPLRERVRRNGGHVHPGGEPLLLLIDIKTEGEATYAALHELLRRYADILTIFAGDAVLQGAVTAIVSGDRPRSTMWTAPVRFAAFDGRIPDLDSPDPIPPSFMPLVSDSWERVTTWKGEGAPPAHLPGELARLAATARAQGRLLRFWATPDRPGVWRVLREAGVDVIGTDDLRALRDFLRQPP